MKSSRKEKMSPNEKALREGIMLYDDFMLFEELGKQLHFSRWSFDSRIISIQKLEKNTIAYVAYEKDKYHFSNGHTWTGKIFLNVNYQQSPKEWAYTVAHSMLHLVFGHFDAENMPGYEKISENGKKSWQVSCDIRLWNEACDIYVAKFLEDIKFGKPIRYTTLSNYAGPTTDERSIYNYLVETNSPTGEYHFGTASLHTMDMKGLEHPAVYDVSKNERNQYRAAFGRALANSAAKAVGYVSMQIPIELDELTDAQKAAKWFVNHYPLLDGYNWGHQKTWGFQTVFKRKIAASM